MDGTIVTFVVPAYNSASTIRCCLDSFLDMQLLPYMEILVVNDGSTDDTANIAAEYSARHPSINLINKENGGHGSVINFAKDVAAGRYFKVIDSDDMVKSENLARYIESLDEADADVVLTNFRTINASTNLERKYVMSGIKFGQTMSFEEFWQKGRGARHVCNFHGITYRTDFYRSLNLDLSERISYEDQEYSTLPFAHVRTVLPLDLFLYEYSLGLPGQSMSDENQVRRLAHKEQVLWRLLGGMDMPHTSASAEYFMYKCGEFLLGYYMAAMVKNPNKTDGRSSVKRLRRKIAEEGHQTLLNKTRKLHLMCMLLSCLGKFGNALFELRRFGVIARLAIRLRCGG